MADQEESSQRAPPMSPPPPPSPAIFEEEESSQRAPPVSPPPPPPPSPANLEDSISEVILWSDSDDSSSRTPHTDLLSLWLSNYTALPQPKAEEEPLEDVPTLLNFDLESSFPDLVDWNTTSTTITQAPVVTQPLWGQLHTPIAGEVDNLSGQALGIQSPKPSILPVALGALGIQFPEAPVSPLAPGTQPPPSSFEMIQSPQASISPLALGIQPPQASSGIETPQASLSPLALGVQSPVSPLACGIQFPEASISPPISPVALGIQSPQTSFGIQSAPASISSLPTISSTLPIAPPVGNFLPSPSPVPERRSWSAFLNTPPPAWRHLLLPHSTSSSVSVPYSHPSHQTHHFPAANTGHQQEEPVAHSPVAFSTPDANANSFVELVPASRPSMSQAMVSHGSWIQGWIPNQPWISNGEDMRLPIPRCPQLLVPPVAATMPELPQLLANFGSFVGNMPSNSNAEEDVPVEGHQRIQTRESSRRSRKKSKLAVRTDKKQFK